MTDTTVDLPIAVAHQLQLPPAVIEALKKDPELLVEFTRGQLAVVQDRMVKRLLDTADASVSQFVAVVGALSANAKLKEAAVAGGVGGTQVTINFIRAPGKEKVVIEGQATRVAEQDSDVTRA